MVVCGHYDCGAVRAALRLPASCPGLVNCWVAGIRDCRNEHAELLLQAAHPDEQVDM